MKSYFKLIEMCADCPNCDQEGEVCICNANDTQLADITKIDPYCPLEDVDEDMLNIDEEEDYELYQ